jgi:hypothetical protein
MQTQVQTAVPPKLQQIGTAVLAIGGIGTATCVLWWLLFYSAVAAESESSLGDLVECLLHTTKKCKRQQMIAILGYPPYKPLLLWLSAAVLLAGVSMKVLSRGAALTTSAVSLTWPCVLSVWWLLLWRGTFGYMLLGAILGLAVNFLGTATDWSAQQVDRATNVAVAAIGAVWPIPVVWMALKKRYSEFQLALMSLGGSAPLATTWHRVLAIWWRLIWRFTIGAVVCGLLMLVAVVFLGFPMQPLEPWVAIGASVAAFIWSAAVVRMAIGTYSDFRVTIVPRTPA